MRSDLHLARKLWHMLTGLCLVAAYMSGASRELAASVLAVIFAFSATIEFYRLRNPKINEMVMRIMGPFMRTSEVNAVSGMPYYAASACLAILLFPKNVAVLSLLFLVFGDPIASTVGILTKNKTIQIIKGKSFQGSFAAFTVCALVTWGYLRSSGMHGVDLIRLTLLGGFAGALAEFLPLDIDDNFTIPMVSGLIMWLGFVVIHFA